MITEEKARAYDEVLNKLRHFIAKGVDPLITRADVQDFFPELKESEDRRYKSAIRKMYSFLPNKPKYIGDVSVENMFAWLEKQGNINPTEDELEALRIAAYEPTKNWSEKLQSLYEKLTHCEQGEQKPVAKYKVGDTIYYDSFEKLVSFVIANVVEAGTDNPMYEDKDGNSVFQNDIVERKPAFEMITPEESLGIDSDTFNKIVDECIYGKQNPAWSEEDEVKINRIVACLKNLNVADNDILLKDVD